MFEFDFRSSKFSQVVYTCRLTEVWSSCEFVASAIWKWALKVGSVLKTDLDGDKCPSPKIENKLSIFSYCYWSFDQTCSKDFNPFSFPRLIISLRIRCLTSGLLHKTVNVPVNLKILFISQKIWKEKFAVSTKILFIIQTRNIIVNCPCFDYFNIWYDNCYNATLWKKQKWQFFINF